MSAVEEIQAAIETLTELRDTRRYSIENGWLIETDESLYPEDPRIPLTMDKYMLILHCTLDAQLAILKLALQVERSELPFRTVRPEVKLARSINGATA